MVSNFRREKREGLADFLEEKRERRGRRKDKKGRKEEGFCSGLRFFSSLFFPSFWLSRLENNVNFHPPFWN